MTGLGHLDGEARRLGTARDGEAVIAAAQRVGGGGHRLDGNDVVAARREELSGRIALLEVTSMRRSPPDSVNTDPSGTLSNPSSYSCPTVRWFRSSPRPARRDATVVHGQMPHVRRGELATHRAARPGSGSTGGNRTQRHRAAVVGLTVVAMVSVRSTSVTCWVSTCGNGNGANSCGWPPKSTTAVNAFSARSVTSQPGYAPSTPWMGAPRGRCGRRRRRRSA